MPLTLRRAFLTCTLLPLILSLLLCGCHADTVGGDTSDTGSVVSETETGATSPLSAKELADALVNTCSFSEALSQNDAYLETHLFGFDAMLSDVTFYTAYVPTSITPEEVLVFVCKDAASADAFVKNLRDYVAYQISEYGDYAPAEVPKLEDAVILQKDKTVVYVVSLDNAAAEDTANGLLK